MNSCSSPKSWVTKALNARPFKLLATLVCPLLCALPSALLWFCAQASAEPRPVRHATLTERISFAGEVERVVMVVSDSVAELHTAPAAWIPSPDKAAIDCIGRVVVAEQAERLEVMFVVLGRDGQARASYREIKLDQLSPAIFLSTTELRERFIERRAELRNVQLEQRTLESNLETLKADADAIAKVSKIVSAEDELERIKGAIKQVSAAYKNIDRLKQQTASRPTPLRAKAREYELTERLQSLSLALSSAETETIKRTASEDLKRKLALIEETREEHIALLEQELAEATKGTARD